MRVCAHTPVRSSERRSHRQRTHRPAERPSAGLTDQNKQQNQASTAQPYAQKGSGGWATKQDTPRTVASALLSSVCGCHAGSYAVPLPKYSACCEGVLKVLTCVRTPPPAPWQSRRRPPLISYARSNLRWTVPHAAQILCSLLRQLMWRYRATTYRLIQCSHQYKMVGMLECACAPTHLYARVSVGPCRYVGGYRKERAAADVDAYA